ncbi:hypothetical protein [Streptomyces olivaceus]|uniref:hypothetical protein n=1 Tax=Streptomyces olivaceus TaxID=47716 RepID=UPI0024909AC2|nr:hypothetical protein [Streptomyces olivaceus]
MSQTILGYRPKDAPPEWDAVADGVRMLVAAVADHVPYRLMAVLHAVARLAISAEYDGLPRDPAVWLEQSTINRFLLTLTGVKPSSITTFASVLARVRETLVWVERGEPARPRLSAHRTRAEPYTTSELARLDAWANALETRSVDRRNAKAMTTLGAGCGLTPSEMLATRGSSIHVLPSDAVVVRPPGSDRLVVCRSLWEEDLADLARAAGDGYLFAPHREVEKPKNAISNWVRRTHPADPKMPPLQMARLRSTWIVMLLRARVPSEIVAKAAGMSTTAALAPYMAWVPDHSPEAITRMLRGAV